MLIAFLIKFQGIGAIPPSAFYYQHGKIAEKFVRFCFIKVSVFKKRNPLLGYLNKLSGMNCAEFCPVHRNTF